MDRSLQLAAAMGALVAGLALTGCAGRAKPVVVDAGIRPVEPSVIGQAEVPPPPSEAPPAAEPGDVTASEVAVEPAETTLAEGAVLSAPPPVPAPAAQSLRDLCQQENDPADLPFDDSRRRLAETFCSATLWFDGLFGGTPDVNSARSVNGRVELSGLHTDFYGLDGKVRLRLSYELPNLQRRVRLFLGREDRDVIADRHEGLAIRSAVFGLETEDEWLAGLGYSPPGRYFRRVDVGVGAKVKTASEVFVKARYRRNFFLGTRDVWRFRETLFYENRDRFGATTSLDWDRVLRNDLLVRWGNVGTVSQESQGLEWRSAMVLYHNLRGTRAVAGEVFWRGATGADVRLREYGARGIYRQPIGAPYLFGDLIIGYTWPRERPHQKREGSMMVGLGVELLFGQGP
jgi:hypothetical protein